MGGKKRQIKLAVHINPAGGNHVAAWMHPRAQKDSSRNASHYLDMARTAERGKFDLIFLADSAATRDGSFKRLARFPQYMIYLEPLTLLSAMAVGTRHVGLVATASTSYFEPYNVARLFGSLDHISGGRAGWNVVTTANAAAALNYGREEHYSHAERYARAREFVDVVKGLWDSWDDDACVWNEETGIYFDHEKVHRLNHKGDFLSVRGPLNMERPPQGHPVLIQAGTSEDGKNLAAEIADMVFVTEQEMPSVQAIYRDIKARTLGFGRRPEDLLVMPGIGVLVRPTAEEARRDYEQLQSLVHPDVGLEVLGAQMNFADLTGADVEKPLPDHLLPRGDSTQERRMRGVLADNPGITVRQLYERFTGARTSHVVVGDPIQCADRLQEWFESEAADGFVIQPLLLPEGLDDFVDLVVPELQRRGLYRRDYEGTTLRENLGLPRPASRYREG